MLSFTRCLIAFQLPKFFQKSPKMKPESSKHESFFRLRFPAVFSSVSEGIFVDFPVTLDLTALYSTFEGFAIFPKVEKSIKHDLQKSTRKRCPKTAPRHTTENPPKKRRKKQRKIKQHPIWSALPTGTKKKTVNKNKPKQSMAYKHTQNTAKQVSFDRQSDTTCKNIAKVVPQRFEPSSKSGQT